MRDMFSTAVYGVCEEQLAYDEESTTFWDYVKNFTRFWGVFTAIGRTIVFFIIFEKK